MATTTVTFDQLDEAVIAYVEWHKHASCVRLAYDAWKSAHASEKARRYAAYLEELDREQRAADLYATASVSCCRLAA
jgi:hypothetical protein